jgi:hypothetical protein
MAALQAEAMFQSIVELQPRSAGGDGGMSVQVRVNPWTRYNKFMFTFLCMCARKQPVSTW